MDDIIIDGNEEVNIKVQGIKGKKGDKGDPGPSGNASRYDLDVQQYGAKGDGVADDTEPILKAVADAKKGDTLFFPRRYLVSKPIVINKNINVRGLGNRSMIYQSTDNDLFVFSRLGGAVIQDIYLGSVAISEGKSLMKLTGHVTRSLFRNIMLQGGYYGIYAEHTLENSFENIAAIALPFFAPCSRNKWWVYIKKTGGRAPNGISFFNLNLSSPWGTNGLYVESGNSEGGINMVGGTIEGLSGVGAEFVSVGAYLSISGMHLEACRPALRIRSCSNVSLKSAVSAGSDVEIRGCNQVNIDNLKIGRYLRIDENSSLVTVDKTKFHDMDVRSSLTEWKMNVSDRSSMWGGGGCWTGQLEKGDDREPRRTGGVEKGLSCFGRENVYRIRGGSWPHLAWRYNLRPGDGKKTVVIRVYAYRENTDSPMPILGIYGGGGGTYVPLPRIPVRKWTPLNAKLYVTPRPGIANFDVRIGLRYTAPETSCLLADPVVIVN